jgi:hypothetical protein
MTDFYGIEPGEGPDFVGLGDQYICVAETPEKTQNQVMDCLDVFRRMAAEDSLAFEAALMFVAAKIEDQVITGQARDVEEGIR